MKFFLPIFVLFQLSLFAQSTIEGTYISDFNGTNANLKRTLILNADGTFLFHNYENHERGIPPEKNIYGKGTWTIEKNLVYFTSSKNDFDDKHTLDFSNTKARFDTKSPRDKSNNDVKTSLRFYESEVFWFKGMILLKNE